MAQVGNLPRYIRRIAESEDEAGDEALEAYIVGLEERIFALETAVYSSQQ